LTIYDASYVALAELLDASVVTPRRAAGRGQWHPLPSADPRL